MRKRIKNPAAVLGAVGALALAAVVWAGQDEIELDDSEIFFEFNSTDNDLGVQIFLDGEGWKEMNVIDPNQNKILKFKAEGILQDVGGITELRFESAEPAPAEVLDAFPEGDYDFEGKTVEGDKLVGEGTLSHDLPEAPVFEIDQDDDEVTIEWDADTTGDVVGWEVIVANEDEGTELFVQFPADTTEFEIPEEYLETGSEFKVEVLAIHENGNKTITEETFELED
ncbi:MAG: fibronectin type III domain-containing protein [Planctomycetota bacterium]|jgi:hypothetical protein